MTIWYMIVVFTAVSFTWHEHLNSAGIILLTAHWLTDRNLIRKLSTFNFQLSTLLLWSFFFLHLLALLWSHHKIEGWQSIEVKLTFFILPVLFSTENYLDSKKTTQLFFIFSISCCISFLYSFTHSYVLYNHLGWNGITERMNVSEGIMHPGYYSNYFAYALVWSIFEVSGEKRHSKGMLICLILIILFLLTALLLLISKTAILFVACFSVYLLWKATQWIKNRFIRIVFFIFALVFFAGLSSHIPSIDRRIAEFFNDSNLADKNVPLSNSTGSRIAAWENEWILIRENWLKGYGTGEANISLKNKLINDGYIRLAEDNMHTHNQVFHTWLDLGIAGILLLFSILFVSAFQFYQQKNKLAWWLIPLIFLNILTDDMLEVQAGTVFFIFFLTLFLYQKKKSVKLSADGNEEGS